MSRVFQLLLLLGWATISAYPQSTANRMTGEFHLKEDASRELYNWSAFAHGHRHGYEAGYLQADQEVHVGHLRRNLRDKDVPGSMGYRREYGNKDRFRQGFIYGFIVGYNDSFDFRDFRLPEWSSDLRPFGSVSALPESDTSIGPDEQTRRHFDEGMIHGYRVGIGSQSLAEDHRGLAGEAAGTCKTEARAGELGYCEGFVQGFLFGTNDRASLNLQPKSGTSAGGHVP